VRGISDATSQKLKKLAKGGKKREEGGTVILGMHTHAGPAPPAVQETYI